MDKDTIRQTANAGAEPPPGAPRETSQPLQPDAGSIVFADGTIATPASRAAQNERELAPLKATGPAAQGGKPAAPAKPQATTTMPATGGVAEAVTAAADGKLDPFYERLKDQHQAGSLPATTKPVGTAAAPAGGKILRSRTRNARPPVMSLPAADEADASLPATTTPPAPDAASTPAAAAPAPSLPATADAAPAAVGSPDAAQAAPMSLPAMPGEPAGHAETLADAYAQVRAPRSGTASANNGVQPPDSTDVSQPDPTTQPAWSNTDSPSRGVPRIQTDPGKAVTGGFGAASMQYFALSGAELATIALRLLDQLRAIIPNDLRFNEALVYPQVSLRVAVEVTGFTHDADFIVDRIMPEVPIPANQPGRTRIALDLARQYCDEVAFVVVEERRETDDQGEPLAAPDELRREHGLTVPAKRIVRDAGGPQWVDTPV